MNKLTNLKHKKCHVNIVNVLFPIYINIFNIQGIFKMNLLIWYTAKIPNIAVNVYGNTLYHLKLSNDPCQYNSPIITATSPKGNM